MRNLKEITEKLEKSKTSDLELCFFVPFWTPVSVFQKHEVPDVLFWVFAVVSENRWSIILVSRCEIAIFLLKFEIWKLQKQKQNFGFPVFEFFRPPQNPTLQQKVLKSPAKLAVSRVSEVLPTKRKGIYLYPEAADRRMSDLHNNWWSWGWCLYKTVLKKIPGGIWRISCFSAPFWFWRVRFSLRWAEITSFETLVTFGTHQVAQNNFLRRADHFLSISDTFVIPGSLLSLFFSQFLLHWMSRNSVTD